MSETYKSQRMLCRKKRRLLTVLFSLAALLIAANSVFAQQGELLREEFHQTYPVSGDARLSVENINGAVRVTTWDRNEVKVDAIKSAYGRDRLNEARIVVRADANAIHIETAYPVEAQGSTDSDPRLHNPAKVDYVLTVPRSVRIDSIEVINGDLDIDGVAGDVRASVVNGRVSGRELMGAVKLSTVNGKVEAIFSRLNESKAISLGSVSGAVVLTIPSDSNAEVKARTVHGNIDNDFGLPVRRGDYVGSDLAGQLGQGGPRIKLGNVSGAISIKHAADGRPLSRVTSLVAEKIKNKDAKDDDDVFEVDEKRSEERRIAREATREATRSQRDARRAQLDSQRAQAIARQTLRRAEVQTARAQADARRAAAEALKAKTAKKMTHPRTVI